jgi:hypothetical protein
MWSTRRPGRSDHYSTLAGILLTDISGLATWFSN